VRLRHRYAGTIVWSLVAGVSVCRHPVSGAERVSTATAGRISDPMHPDAALPDDFPTDPHDVNRLNPRSCADAKKYAAFIHDDDVRFAECGRPRPTTGEAFTLGPPIYIPPHGPAPQQSKWYAPGHCETGGGAITERNIYYEPKNLGAAFDCSKKRCDSGDALGCRDLGALNWDDLTLPGVKKDAAAAAAAYHRGCDLGDGESCWELTFIYEQDLNKPERALPNLLLACNAREPVLGACIDVGERIARSGKTDALKRAKSFWLRGCRGVTHTDNPFEVDRYGCTYLADLASERGDLSSEMEYRRLACAYGEWPLSLPRKYPNECAVVGLSEFRAGDGARALPYLKRACGILPEQKQAEWEACIAADKIEQGMRTGK
jgi:hypothetical protein